MGQIVARIMEPDKPQTRRYPGGLCPDCNQPACDHLDASGMVDLGCPQPGQPMWTRQLAASAEITVLATVLAIAHFKHEGWGELALPLTGELQRIYHGAAEYAVRFCSEADRKVAEDRAVGHALTAIGQALMAPQFTPDTIAAGVKAAIHDALDIYRHSLMHGTASPVEMVSIADSINSSQENQ
jgi:hypothetical protein